MTEQPENSLVFVEQIRKHVVENKIMLSYKGEISQEIILALLEMTEKKLDSSNAEYGLKSKIFNVMVNCLQNITFHTEKNEHSKSSMFAIGRNDENHAVYSGNAIRKERIPELKEKLDQVKKMSEEELNNFYKYWLKTRELSEKKGIGLGLIDIARKTGSDLDYDFDRIDSDYNYFSLRTVVKASKNGTPKNNDGTKNPVTQQKSLKHFFDYQELVKANDVIFLYASDFSQELTKTLLAFTEKKLSFEELEDIVRKKIFNIMVEMLQNISKNAIDKDNTESGHIPIFMIAESDKAYYLISSNKILSTDIEKIKSKIDQVNALDSAGLKQLYKETRLNSRFSEVGGAGIGIIDMARKSGERLNYDFQTIDQDHAMFSLFISISKNYS
jgi:hypothetical protein